MESISWAEAAFRDPHSHRPLPKPWVGPLQWVHMVICLCKLCKSKIFSLHGLRLLSLTNPTSPLSHFHTCTGWKWRRCENLAKWKLSWGYVYCPYIYVVLYLIIECVAGQASVEIPTKITPLPTVPTHTAWQHKGSGPSVSSSVLMCPRGHWWFRYSLNPFPPLSNLCCLPTPPL